VVDAVASDYQDRVTFVCVAQNSTPEASAARVGVWFSPDRMLWGYSDEIGPQYGVRGQPVSVLITSRGKIAATWFGGISESEMRAEIDRLIELSA
jgi:hypothetical protein